MSKPLLRLVYRSRSTLHPDNVEELDKIFHTSIKNNARNQLSGCLAHPDGHFVQVIEGYQTQVELLLAELQADARHADLVVLGRWVTPARLFSGWAMARPDVTPLAQQSLRIINDVGTGAQVTAIMLGLVETSKGFYPFL